MALLFVHGKCQHYYESGQTRAVRGKGGLPNKALQSTSRALPRAKKTKRVGGARG